MLNKDRSGSVWSVETPAVCVSREGGGASEQANKGVCKNSQSSSRFIFMQMTPNDPPPGHLLLTGYLITTSQHDKPKASKSKVYLVSSKESLPKIHPSIVSADGHQVHTYRHPQQARAGGG